MEGLSFSGLAGSEPDLIPTRRPGETLLVNPLACQRFLVSGQVHNRNPSTIVPLRLVIHEGNHFPVRRDARVAYISARFIKHAAYRILELIAPVDIPDNCEILAIRRPVSLLNIFDYLARSPTNERHSS